MRGQLLAWNTTVTARALVGTDRCPTDRYLDADSPQFACACFLIVVGSDSIPPQAPEPGANRSSTDVRHNDRQSNFTPDGIGANRISTEHLTAAWSPKVICLRLIHLEIRCGAEALPGLREV